MKKRIGELNGTPIVIGDSNLVTNEYYLENDKESKKFFIYKRGLNGKLECVTLAEEEEEEEDVETTSLLDEEDPIIDESNTEE